MIIDHRACAFCEKIAHRRLFVRDRHGETIAATYVCEAHEDEVRVRPDETCSYVELR